MKNSVKLILTLILSSFFFSCTNSNEDVIPSSFGNGQITLTPNSHYLNVTMVPNGAVCNNEFIVRVKLQNSSGYEYTETMSSNESGLIHFSHNNDFKSGAYSIYFTIPGNQSIIGSTSFYITSEDLQKEYYNKTIEYNNCDM